LKTRTKYFVRITSFSLNKALYTVRWLSHFSVDHSLKKR